MARLIVHLVESLNGIRAVQAFRRESRNEQFLDGLAAAYRDANTSGVPQRGLVRGQHPGRSATSRWPWCCWSGRCGWPTARWSSAR